MPVINSRRWLPKWMLSRDHQRLNRAEVEVLHRSKNRIVLSHHLDETCDCCETINKLAETKGESEPWTVLIGS